jgi:hypothetical protein
MEAKQDSVQTCIHNTELTYRVFGLMRSKKECDLEDLMQGCEPYPWEEVLGEVVRLSRMGDLRIVYKPGGEYTIRLCPTRRR